MYQLRPADLIFVRGTGPISHVIEDITHSPYSHVAGVVKPNELVESQALRPTGYEALDAYAGEYDVYTCDELTDDEREAIVKWAIGQQGAPYNYGLLGWEYLHFRLHLDLPMKDGPCYDCSELWREAYRQRSHILLCPDLKHVAPGDLVRDKQLRKVELKVIGG